MDPQSTEPAQSNPPATHPGSGSTDGRGSRPDRVANGKSKSVVEEPGQPADPTHESRNGATMLDGFVNRTYTTFVSRARAAERLTTRGMLWTIALAVSSTLALALSVVSLSNPQYMGGKVGLTGCLFSILTLVLSLVVGLFNYNGRARDMFHSYRTIQRVSAEAEIILANELVTEIDIVNALHRLDAAYQLGLDQSENHSRLDFYKARKISAQSTLLDSREKRMAARAAIQQGILNYIPVSIIVVSVGLLGWLLLTT